MRLHIPAREHELSLTLCAVVSFVSGAMIAIMGAIIVTSTPVHAARATCVTDTECAQLCPPSDTSCDGGPQH